MLKVTKAEAATANAGKKLSFKVTTTTNTSTPLMSGSTANASASIDTNQTCMCKYVYLLTEIEHLLLDHKGCMKCWAEALDSFCNKPPLLAMYILLTKDLAETARKHYIAMGGKLKNMGKGTLIATVTIDGASNSSDGDGSNTGHAYELVELEEDYAHVEEYVFSTHIIWDRLINAPSIFPSSLTCLY
ncbi:hypothetical protein C0995_003922 [Termitomyces sp. Mi166|nr:hypothetical protein C0995_003922 [Termitomyces sp. Mi166\